MVFPERVGDQVAVASTRFRAKPKEHRVHMLSSVSDLWKIFQFRALDRISASTSYPGHNQQ